ncbi:EpsI family protein [Thermodesulfatator indicus DSM 15286]|uniref:EpsI family protein n=1 Tax=Thermodesulfatator indicus (strain DSM 15286 / JCM 11887 / CIR29812) TaxID=667014 RepID=F8AE14_THEID|nr:exosortase C-terminal domain/associated protein EpsI [Thermodesulfatator indicus]AEH44984.1 EpsI family protein [Thermodesulfatator indicus DSM 15286]
MIKKAIFLAAVLVLFSLVMQAVSTIHPVPIKKDLALFPREIAGYKLVKEERMPPKVEKVLGVDNYIMREYCQKDTCISLYVGYFEEQQEGAMIHSPKHCMPGGGWLPIDDRIITLNTPHGQLKVNRFLLQKGDEKLLVYYWYQGRGRKVASEYEDRLYLLLDRLLKQRSDGALVRLMVPLKKGNEKKLKEFTRALVPILDQFLPS